MKRESIIIADATKGIEKPLNHYLGGAFDLTVVSGAEDLKKAFLKNEFSLMVVDVFLPVGQNGLEVASEIIKNHPETMLGTVSASGSRSDVLKARQMGTKFFLLKPYPMKEMTRQINSLFKTESIASGRTQNNQLHYRIMIDKSDEPRIICELKGEISLYNADEIDRILRTIVKTYQYMLSIDLSEVSSLDTRAFEVLSGLAKSLIGARTGMEIAAVSNCLDRFTRNRIIAQLPISFNPEPSSPECIE